MKHQKIPIYLLDNLKMKTPKDIDISFRSLEDKTSKDVNLSFR